MRLLGKVALGGGLVSAATATWLVAAGVFATSATLVALDPGAPKAQAAPKPLTVFESCPALLDWYVSNAVKEVGPYGWESNDWGRGPWFDVHLQRGSVPKALSNLTGSYDTRSAPVSGTGTNTQEAAVDEPDIAKTNGTLIARIVDDNALVLVDVTGAEPRVTGRLDLPRNGYSNELLLVGDHVLVTQQTFTEPEQPHASGKTSYIRYAPSRVATRLFDIDISDPANPRMLSRDRYSGDLLSARQYGDTVRLVTATRRPELNWFYPSGKLSRREATRRNKALVRSTPIERWLPSVIRNGARGTLINCEQVLHPKTYAGDETVAVTTFTAEQSDQRTAVAVTAGGGIVYSSADRLYVATTDRSGIYRAIDSRMPMTQDPTTALHAFDLTGPQTTYVGSGDLNGNLRDRWSLDEYDGHLRVAWTKTGKTGRTHNGISIFTERDGALVPTASIGNLGINEDLQSVRWFDHLAVLVTFRQVDPLYTVDLTDQDNPKLIGVLKIPGYSGYLHPIGNDLLLGLGMSGDENGATGGAQAAVFDISNLKKPVQVSQTTFGHDSYLQALEDPRAFTWVPATSTAVTPLSNWMNGSTRMMALHVNGAGKLNTYKLSGLNDPSQTRSFALPDGRIAVLDGHRVLLVPGQP